MKRGSHAKVRDLTEEIGTMVLLLDWECLRENNQAMLVICIEAKALVQGHCVQGVLTSASEAPAMVTSLISSSCVGCFPGGQAFHLPDTDTAVPVERLRSRKELLVT